MPSEEDRALALRLVRAHSPTTEAGQALAAKVASRLSQVASAPAPALETLATAQLAGKTLTVQSMQEKTGRMMGPACYCEVVVFEGAVRTAMRLPGAESLFEKGAIIGTIFSLLGDRAAETAERLAALPIAPPSPVEISVGEVKDLEDLNLRLEPVHPPPRLKVGGVLDATLRVFLGPA